MKVEDYDALLRHYESYKKSSRGRNIDVIQVHYEDGRTIATNRPLTDPFIADDLSTIHSFTASDRTPLDEWYENEIKAAEQDDKITITWAENAVNTWVTRVLTLPGAELVAHQDSPLELCKREGRHLVWFDPPIKDKNDAAEQHNDSYIHKVLQPFDLLLYRSPYFHGAGLTVPMSVKMAYLLPTPEENETMDDFGIFYSIRECQRVTAYDLKYFSIHDE